MFRSTAPNVVRRTFELSAEDTLGGKTISKIRAGITSRLKLPRAAYWGGEANAKDLLIKKDGERDDSFNERLQRAFNVKAVSLIVNARASLVYGVAPERSVWYEQRPRTKSELAYEYLKLYRAGEEDPEIQEAVNEETQALGEVYTKIMEANRHEILMVTGMQQRGRDGGAWLKVFNRTDALGFTTDIGMSFLPQFEDFIPIPDPDDAATFLGGVEVRRGTNRLWTLSYVQDGGYVSGYHEVDDSLGRTGPDVIFGTSKIPFVLLGSGVCDMQDAAREQQHVINLENINTIVRTRQGHAIPVVKGDIKNPVDGQKRVTIGPNDAVQLEADGDFYLAQFNAPIGEHREGVQAAYGNLMRRNSMPSDFYKDSTGVEKPLAKKLSWTPTLMQARDGTREAEAFERETAKVVFGLLALKDVGAVYQIGQFDPDSVGFSARFSKDPLPTDNRENERHEAEKVVQGLQLTTDYIIKTEGATMTAKQIGRKAFLLEEEKATQSFDSNIPGLDLASLQADLESGAIADVPEPAANINELSLAAQRLGSIGDVDGYNYVRRILLDSLPGGRTPRNVKALERPAQGRSDDA